MSFKIPACIALLCALISSGAQAAPQLLVYPIGISGGNRQWYVDIIPDLALFTNSGPMGSPPNTLGGSLAAEIGFSIDAPVSLVTAMIDNVALWPAENFGNSPFPFGEAPDDGLTIQANQLFVAQGSDYLTPTSSKHFLKITTAGIGPTTVRWLGAYNGNGRIAQAGANFDLYKGFVSVPEPSACAIASIALAASVVTARRRRSS